MAPAKPSALSGVEVALRSKVLAGYPEVRGGKLNSGDTDAGGDTLNFSAP